MTRGKKYIEKKFDPTSTKMDNLIYQETNDCVNFIIFCELIVKDEQLRAIHF